LGASAANSIRTLTGPVGRADERADLAVELDRLVLGQVAEVHDLDLAVGVLVYGERVDHAHGVTRS